MSYLLVRIPSAVQHRRGLCQRRINIFIFASDVEDDEVSAGPRRSRLRQSATRGMNASTAAQTRPTGKCVTRTSPGPLSFSLSASQPRVYIPPRPLRPPRCGPTNTHAMLALRVARVGLRAPSLLRPRLGTMVLNARPLSTRNPDMKPPCEKREWDHRRRMRFRFMLSTIGDLVGHAGGAVFMLVGCKPLCTLRLLLEADLYAVLAFYHYSGLEWMVDTYRETKSYVRAKTRAVKRRTSNALTAVRTKCVDLRGRVSQRMKGKSLSDKSADTQDEAREHTEETVAQHTEQQQQGQRRTERLKDWVKSRGGSQ